MLLSVSASTARSASNPKIYIIEKSSWLTDLNCFLEFSSFTKLLICVVIELSNLLSIFI